MNLSMDILFYIVCLLLFFLDIVLYFAYLILLF